MSADSTATWLLSAVIESRYRSNFRRRAIRMNKLKNTSRAELLADRIEEGAALLAAFAAELSEAEWRTPVSATDRRPVGVIVHHVASVYPVEIEVARTIARGEAVTDVTWEAIEALNARHAQDQAGATKAATLELLR